jgi:hypothetical protein
LDGIAGGAEMKTPEDLADEHTKAWWGDREDNITIATRQSFLAGYHLRDEEIEQLEIQIANLKAEIKEEWREEVANLKEQFAMLKAELREVGNE